MLSKLYTACLQGLDCRIVEVEVDFRKGNTYFAVVGLAGKSIQEARDRIPSAIRSAGASFIPMKIIMNLAPAELIKTGPSYDLPLAIGYLLASEQLAFAPQQKLFIGELALDGSLRPIKGVLPIADGAKKHGFTELYLPFENANEASLVEGIQVYGVKTLRALIEHLNGGEVLTSHHYSKNSVSEAQYKHDFAQVRGQEVAKRALEIAAAGGHNILLSGVPGSGKTLLSKCLPSILPELTLEESLEVTRVYSIAGLISDDSPLIQTRPFRSPHHTTSEVAIVGGGSYPRPGEISLAHRGVLFLDEFPEFSSQALEALRQPLEDKVINISRANATLTFPASFILAAAMNPCKCGYRGDPVKQCTCSNLDMIRYSKKISGPILDRIDLLLHVPKVENAKLFAEVSSESSDQIRNRVQAARAVQLARFARSEVFCNAEMTQREIEKFITLSSQSKTIMNMAINKMNLSARAYYRILKVARTIADLEGNSEVIEQHVSEALSYRNVAS